MADADEVWERFTLDGNEALTAIEESLLKLETARNDRAELNRLYRGLHTLKGNSGFMGLGHLEHLAHACEDLIGLFRDGGHAFDDESVELILSAVDTLRTLVETVARARKDVEESAIAAPLAALEKKARTLAGGPVASEPAEAPAAPPPPAPEPEPEAPTAHAAPAEEFIDPGADIGYLEIFLSMARETLKNLSLELANLLVERTDAGVQKTDGVAEELQFAAERMGFLLLVDSLEALRKDLKTLDRPERLAQLELDVHAQVVAVETQYRALAPDAPSFGITDLYERACGNAAFADLASLREELEAPAIDLPSLKALFTRLTAACRYYGFKQGLSQALDVEDRLYRALEGGALPGDELKQLAAQFVEGLGKAIFAANAGDESPDVAVLEAPDDPMKFAPEVDQLPFSPHLRPGLTRTGLGALTHFRGDGRCVLELHAALEDNAALNGPFSKWMESTHASLISSGVVERASKTPLYVFLVGLEQPADAALASFDAIDPHHVGLRAYDVKPGQHVPPAEDFVPGTAPAEPPPPAATAPLPTAPVAAPAPTAPAPPPRGGFHDVPNAPPPPAAEAAEASDEPASRTEFLRIDARKVSLIMDMAGEIGLACGAVTHHPDVVGRDLEGFNAAAHKLELLIRELQNEVSALRLVPVDGVFQRMKRVVRDTARRTHKQVELTLVGEDTEIDKLMVDALHDPLVHMLRNAIDHGLETPDDRRAANKGETGKLVLEASHQGGEVLVQLSDDGRGLNRDKIRARAIERGLIKAEDQLSDQQICELIFLPGFSTKENIDELSGRGVGMDVVKTTIEGLRGRVQVTSTEGRGTRIRLSVPLTLAFVEAMIVRERDRLFAVPIEKVFEVFQVEREQVTHDASDGVSLVRVRERLVPVLWLHKFYEERSKVSEELDGRILVVVQTSRGELALPVDQLLGNQQVMLKPLVGPLSRVRAAAGCGMLRTGEVALALDCERLSA
ncbi:MAG: ATP-binding protein [Myxococcaceae bacterium]